MSRYNSIEMSDALSAMREAGLMPSSIICDGKLHRCRTVRHMNKKNGSYVAHNDASGCVVWYKNWETRCDKTWFPNNARKLSKKEQEYRDKFLIKVKRIKEKDEANRYAEGADTAKRIYEMGKPVKNHPYLKAKGVQRSRGLKIQSTTGRIIIPFSDENDKITTLQFIDDEGNKRFLKSGKKTGSFFCIGDLDGPDSILIAEGLSTGLSLHECTKCATVIAGDSGNMKHVAQTIKTLHPENTIVICADNDLRDDGSLNTGVAAANDAAYAIGGVVAVPKLKSGEKCDFNDVHQKEGKESVLTLVQNAEPPFNMPEVSKLPCDYSYRPAGGHLDLYYKDSCLGRALFVLAKARTSKGEGWGRLLAFCDDDNKHHKVYIPSGELVSPQALWLRELADKGWVGVPEQGTRGHIAKFISQCDTGRRVLLIDAVGWYEDVYVLPSRTIGKIVGDHPVLRTTPENKFQVKGSLAGWQKTTGTWAIGNSRLTMAIGGTLATFLLRYYDWAESFGLHFFGTSSRGKTTSLQAAASCCGHGGISGGYMNSWLATANGIEGLAALHRDAPLFLDEMSKADARAVSQSAYVIAGGQGKAGMDANRNLRSATAWRTIVLSTGETTFAGHLAKASIQPQAGQMVRFLDIPAPEDSEYWFFENIHDHESGIAFVNALKQAAVDHYGHIGPAFVEKLIEEGHKNIETRLKKYLTTNIHKLCGEDADPQVQRVAGHFLICAFAGQLATEWGLLPWKKGDVFRAAKKCFQAWLTTRGSTHALEDEDVINRVRLLIERHGDSRFQRTDNDKALPVRDRIGFICEVKGQTRYLFLTESFQKEICMGHNPTLIAKILHDRGWLIRDNQGFKVLAPHELPGLGRIRCYTIIIPKEGA